MQQANPYAVPNAPVEDVYENQETADINIFTPNGRLGRVRYFYYSTLVGVVGMIGIMLASLLINISPLVAGIIIAALYIAMIVLGVFLAIQRSHDLNKSGWLSLLLLVPFAFLYFYFAPGSKGTNHYGAQPPANSKGVIAGAIAIPLVMIVLMGILSAIAIPSYSEHAGQTDALDIQTEMAK